MHIAPLIHDLAVILAIASAVALIFQRIRQPVVLGYILVGMIVGPYTAPGPIVSDIPNIRIWAELGVIFLMFSLGLEFSFRKLARVGFSAVLTATFQVLFMLTVGFLIGEMLGWRLSDSLFTGAMISISSTTIIIKALDEMGLKTRRFAELIFAILIVEDLAAILLLVALSSFAMSHFSGLLLLGAAGRLILIAGTWFLAGYFVVPRAVEYVGRRSTPEILTLVSLGLCLCLAVFAAHFEYSVALGAFIMGSILSESTESYRIEDRVAPLTDLFAAIFFVSVGMLIDPHTILENWKIILLLTAVTVFGKIFAVSVGALISGQTLRTSVQVGFGMAQIGEFSFIIASLGRSLRVTSDFIYPVAVAVSLLTTLLTPFLIRRSHQFAVWLEGRIPVQAREILGRYIAWSQARQADRARNAKIYNEVFRWSLNGLVTSAIFVLMAELALPWIIAFGDRMGATGTAAMISGWLIAILLSSPFIWAMFSASKQRLSLFAARLAAIFWIGLLSIEFFPARVAVGLTAMVVAVFFLFFYRQLEMSYRWFESSFLSTFEERQKSRPKLDVLRDLAPWDAHLVRIKVHPNADVVDKSLGELKLRSSHGISVVAIQRGLKTIVAPKPVERILPKDELLVLATDEQVDTVRNSIERPPGLQERFKQFEGYEMRPVQVPASSPLCSRTIRDSGIRDRFGAMVVGIERDRERIINPQSDSMIEAGDRLWIVGPTSHLDRLLTELQGGASERQ